MSSISGPGNQSDWRSAGGRSQNKDHVPDSGDKAKLLDNSIYPFRQTRYTELSPDGGTEAARKLVDTAFPQLAAILQAGASVFGLGPEQISPFVSYNRPQLPGYYEAKYASDLGGKHRVFLGEVDSEMLKESLKAVAMDVAEGLAIDVATQAVPVAGAAIQVGMVILDNKDMLKTTEGRQQLAKSAGFAVASLVPGLNIIAVPAMLVASAIEFVGAKSKMQAEITRGKELQKMLEDNLDAAIEEARALSVAMADRGISQPTESDSAWTGRLREHYQNLVLAAIDDYNKTLDLAKAQYIVEKGMSFALDPKALDKFKHVPRTLHRVHYIQFFLQFARDMHRVHAALTGQLKPVGSASKTPEEVASEIRQIAASMLAQNPLMPIQEVMNLASATARGTAAPVVDPQQAAAFAQGVSEKVKTNSALLVGGGSVALLAAVKFLPMLLRGGR